MTVEIPASERFMVVGFDLGHAQTAVATVWADSGAAPKIARLHNGEFSSQVHPTAVARYADPPGSTPITIVGTRCFGMLDEYIAPLPPLAGEGHDGEAVPNKDVHLAFKSADVRPGTRSRYATGLFVAAVVRQLTEPDLRSGSAEFVAIPPATQVRWVFGVPSGWDLATCVAYEDLLREVVCGLHPAHEVLVVPESRAAMLASREQVRGARGGSGALPADLGSALIIDMGSLTTDYTYVADLREAIRDKDIGQLGAGLIDQLLLRLTIDQHEPARDRVLIERAIDDNYQRMRLEFACRQAKERYFSAMATGPLTQDAVLVSESVRSSTGARISVPVRVSREMMEDVLTTPVEGAGTYGRLGWREAFRAEIGAVRGWLRDEYGELPQTVLLTGGAARMTFAQAICREVFDLAPDGEQGRRLIYGSEPEYAIATGLAIAGRTEHRIAQFRAEAATFAQERVPELIREHLPSLASALGSIAFTGLVEQELCPEVRQWRSGDIKRLDDVPARVLEARRKYLAGPVGSAAQEEAIAAWYDQVTLLINQEARVKAGKYEVPAGWFSVPRAGTVRAEAGARINVKGALAVMRIIANTTATVMSVVTAVVTLGIVGAVLEAAAAAAAAAGVASTATPAGPVVVTVVGGGAVLAGIWGGKGYLMRKAREANLPVWMRKIGTEDYLLGRVRKRAAKDELEEGGARAYAKAVITEAGDQIVADFSGTVEEQLAEAARRAAIWIERRDA